jgi:Leucine-rich repeat (LRR) protein
VRCNVIAGLVPIAVLHIASCLGLTQETALQVVQNAGGRVIREGNLPDRPVVGVDLRSSSIGDRDLDVMKDFPALKSLNLGSTDITDAGLRALRNLRGLETLGLGATLRITDGGIEYISGLSRLRELDLTFAPITDEGLSHIKKLASLEALLISGTAVTDSGLKYIESLRALKRLHLGCTLVTDAGMVHLQKLQNLQELALTTSVGGEPKVTDTGLLKLKGLPRLRRLYLPEYITDAGVKRLPELFPDLEVLSLAHTEATDEGLLHVAQLKKIVELDLGETRITDAGLARIRTLKNLRKLRLAETRVTDAGIADLRAAIKNIQIVRH